MFRNFHNNFELSQATLILKQVTGNVRILVVNPKDEEDKRNSAAAVAAEGAKNDAANAISSKAASTEKATLSPDRAATEGGKAADKALTPAKSPVKADAKAGSGAAAAKTPAKSPGKSPAKKDDNAIELKKDANGVGISIVGGTDTPLVIAALFFFQLWYSPGPL